MKWITYHKQLLQLAEVGETLTPSQILTRRAILDALKKWKQCINLWGAPGVGKTFLVHSMHHSTDLVYFSDWTQYDTNVSQYNVVAIDNAPHNRQLSRRIYDAIRWGKGNYTGPVNIILITRQTIDDDVYHIELSLTESDITHIEETMQQQFGEYNFETVNEFARRRSGLWRYIRNLTQLTD